MLNAEDQPLIHRMRNLDAGTYMPGAVLAKVDRMSMRVSLEVRCPLLDKAVAKFAQRLRAEHCWMPPDGTKRVLKELTARYVPSQWLQRRKMGFGLPANAWSRDSLLLLAEEALLSQDGQLRAVCNDEALRKLLAFQGQPGCFSIYQVWPLLLLELWLRNALVAPVVA
jgi:asparagine synthase (glutamine-hydrolysing)